MPMLRITAETHKRLILLKKGMDTFDDVIKRLLLIADDYQQVPDNSREPTQGKGD